MFGPQTEAPPKFKPSEPAPPTSKPAAAKTAESKPKTRGCRLGCFSLMLVLAVLGLAGWIFIDWFGEFADNPSLAAAKILMALDSDLELVSVDEKTGAVQLLDRPSGEITTIDLTSSSPSEEIPPELQEQAGGGSGEPLFDEWAEYPGEVTTRAVSMEADGKRGSISFRTPDGVDEVVAFYQGKLPERQFELTTSRTAASGRAIAQITGRASDGSMRLSAVRLERETVVTITWELQ